MVSHLYQYCSSMTTMSSKLVVIRALLFILCTTLVQGDDSVWSYAPDFSKDAIQPYPDLKDSNGNNITVENLRGVHLFGFKGCAKGDADGIKQAYNDFYTLSNQLSVYNNIDWKAQAATDFWGPASGPNQIPDGTRKEIQRR
jgi:hypothetical protein